METEVIQRFIPDLVTAISDYVQSVLDQCLTKGLISQSTYRRMLESGETSEEKARTLILEVKKSTEADNRCLEILLDILEQQRIRDKLLSEMRKHISENTNTSKAVMPSVQNIELVLSRELAEGTVLQHSALLGKFEEAVRQHAKCCTEKNLSQERLKVKTEERERLKREIVLADQTDSRTQKPVTDVKNKLETCDSEMTDLKARVEELEKAIEQQDMQVKRSRSTIVVKTREILVQRSQATEPACDNAKERMKEMEMRMREMEKEQNLLLQEKEARIKELEADLKLKQHEGALNLATQIPKDRLTKLHARPLYDSMITATEDGNFYSYRQLGTRLNFSKEEMRDIQKNSSGDCTEEDYLFLLMLRWLEQYPGDSRGSTKFPTYTDLEAALIKAGEGDIARKLIPYKDLQHV